MNKLLTTIGLLILGTTFLFALEGEIVFVEGEVDLKTGSGSIEYADMGMTVQTGDSIMTGYDGYAEIEMEDGSLVRVMEDSIFKFQSVNTEQGNRNSFQLVLGSAGYKFTKSMKEDEPYITTPSTVCGLRGTEFTVYSGIDGSALYVVDEGSVAVSSQGEEVQLYEDEGVKVKSGEAPGEVFEILRGKEDYSKFLSESEDDFYSDPAAAIYPLMDQLVEHADQADTFQEMFDINTELLQDLRDEWASKTGDDKLTFYETVVFPTEINVSGMKHNVRYHAISAESLRQFVVGTMYIKMTTLHINDRENNDYLEFMNAYNHFLDIYATRIGLYLVEADIE